MAKNQKSKSSYERDPKVSGLRPVGEVVAYCLAELKSKQQEHCTIFNKLQS